MSLVDRLINAIQEQDVLYTIVWIKEIKEDLFLEGDLGQKINKLHSTEDCTPFSAAVELCESPLREIILQILLLSGADFRGCRIWAKTQEMTRRLTQVLQAWERGGKNQAHDAEMLLKLPLEEAADWIDEHLPLPPNANSLTGAEIPLPPSPRSTPILASVSLQSPPCISFSLPDARARHNSGRSAGGEKQGQVDEILKSRNKAAPIVSIPVKDAQHLAHLPSPPPTAELAATASFSSPLRIRSPPSENAEPSSSPAQQSVLSSSLIGPLVRKSSRRRRRSSNSRSPRIPNADFAKSSLIRSPSRTQSPQRLSSPLSRPRPIRRSLSPPIPPHPARRSRPRFRSPPPPRPHRRVQSRSPSPHRATRRFTSLGRPREGSLSPRRPRGRSPSPSFARQRSPSPRFERKRSSTPQFRIGEPLRYDLSSGLRPVIRQVQSSRW